MPKRKTAAGKSRGKRRGVRAARPGAAASRTRAIEATLADIAHEIRTPLTGILALGELLTTSELGERERGWAAAIKSTAEHLALLTSLIVDAARADAKGLVLRRELIRPRRFADMVAASLSARAEAKGIAAEVDLSSDLPEAVIGDPLRLRAALENLIDNAVKFTEHGRVALAVTPASVTKGKIGVAFAVSDSGIGLTLKEIKRLFRPFSQANVSIASRFGGAGLGLSSVKQLARSMGGDIKVTPRDGGGTTFTLTVALTSAEAKAATPEDGEEPSPQPVPPLRVLSVEDNPFGRVVLNTILCELGHQAEFVSRGEAASERIAQGSFDAVLMDMVLPGIDGIEAIRRIRALGPPLGRIAIIGVSGRGEDEAASRAAGADAFLLKPVSPRALATALLEATHRAAAAT
jgi:two-component system, sensor histidine kinase